MSDPEEPDERRMPMRTIKHFDRELTAEEYIRYQICKNAGKDGPAGNNLDDQIRSDRRADQPAPRKEVTA